jgi:hypothetical protein
MQQLLFSSNSLAGTLQTVASRTTQTIQCSLHLNSPQSRPWASPKVCLVCGCLGGSALACWRLREAQLAACQASQHPKQTQGAAAAAVDDDLQIGTVEG